MGAILVYDVTKRSSFNNVSRWLNDIKLNSDQRIIIMLVGNKTDIPYQNPSKREVTKEEGLKFANENKLLFTESSALSNHNVNEMFEELLIG